MALDFSPLRVRNFRLLASARTISFFGTNLAPIAVAFGVLDLTGSATDVGIAFACWTLAQISTLLVGGVTGEAIGALAGGIAGLRFRPRRAMRVIGALFIVTGLQSVLLASHAPAPAIGAAALLAGFAFSFGTVIWETALQRAVAPDKLARVGAYNWVGAMAFLPAGYAIAGPVASMIGMSTTLWIGFGWIVASTLFVISVRDVRDFELGPAEESSDLEAAVAAT